MLSGMSQRLDARRWPGHSALVVPAPPLERWVRSRTHHYDAAYLSDDPAFPHAHLTLLAPFVAPRELTPRVQRRVAEVLRGHPPFSVTVDEVAAFPDGTVHLVPVPDRPLRRLTAALWAAFPAFPPYAGQFPDAVPHLTLDRVGEKVSVASVRDAVTHLVPTAVEVTEAVLSWYEQGACRTLASWRLGSAPSQA